MKSALFFLLSVTAASFSSFGDDNIQCEFKTDHASLTLEKYHGNGWTSDSKLPTYNIRLTEAVGKPQETFQTDTPPALSLVGAGVNSLPPTMTTNIDFKSKDGVLHRLAIFRCINGTKDHYRAVLAIGKDATNLNFRLLEGTCDRAILDKYDKVACNRDDLELMKNADLPARPEPRKKAPESH